ncbi:MAG: pantothenate kinase [Clostridia bacterium]|nr:pantothenate kinase [Clostridia bacterium]
MEKEKIILGIDVGGSTTKIVGFRKRIDGIALIEPQFIRAADPITSIYGAFGRFTLENGLALQDIEKVMMTGVGSSFLSKPIYELPCESVNEFECVGRGGLYISGLDEAVVVSMGTGTALIHAKRPGPDEDIQIVYMGGTGIGGGTMMGLNRKMLGVDSIDHIEQLCSQGNLDNIDLRVKDLTSQHNLPKLNKDLTASNFGKLSDLATPSDLSLGIANLVAESILMLSVFAARSCKLDKVVLTGNLTGMEVIRDVFRKNSGTFGIDFIIPERAQFGPVIGAALSGLSR